jgi:P27 family predicted phage terminase small subunit
MRRQGQRPKPLALHKLHGTVRTSTHTDEPEAPGELLAEAPAWMTAAQRDAWRYAVENAPASILRRIDAGTLATWAVAYAEHREAVERQAELDASTEHPLLKQTRLGELVESPYLRVINRSALRMLRAAEQLGFSPTARPRLGGGSGPAAAADENPWSQFAVLPGGKERA